MSQQNLISATITDADKQTITQQLEQIKQLLSNVLLFNLSPLERKKLVKMGDKSQAFVSKAIDYGVQYPALVPSFVSMEEAQKDLTLSMQLSEISQLLMTLTQGVEDARMVSGAEAMDAARAIFNAVKAAANSNIPGTHAIHEDLSKRFVGRPKKSKQPDKPAE